ncbi:His-Xaa-Ser system protein HxsD [Bradyrhizobium sp. USDA 3051]
MLPMPLMPPAAKLSAASQVEVAVDFDSSIQSLSALDAAAYRLIGSATCQVDRAGDRYICRLVSSGNPQKGAVLSSDELKERFLYFVADENMRIRVAEKTEGVRNVILALAFGALVANQNDAG